jgi:hypothetical protein
MLWMKEKAYEETTIRRVAKELRHLKRSCNISSPKETRLFIANKACSNARKENLAESYSYAIQSLNLHWGKPFFKRRDMKRRAPNEKLLGFMINHFRLEMALKCAMMKDIGTRPIELTGIYSLRDIDLTTRVTSLTGAKFTKGRTGKLKPKTLDLLKLFIEKKHRC